MTKKTKILFLLLLLAGLAVLSYPLLSDYLNRLNGSWAMEQVREAAEQAEPEQLQLQRQQAEAYNQALLTGKTPEGYEEILNISDGVMGYVRIPSIGVNLPIYHGVTEEVLQKGVGHMPQSAFPIGGAGNHAVLTGHTGLPSAQLFTDLTELKAEDLFCIRILGEDLTYQVEDVRVVLPEQTKDLQPVPGEDYCTLVTCTPYGINSHRLLVRGKRIQLSEQEIAQQLPQPEERVSMPAGLVVAIIAAGALLILLAVVIFQKKGA